MSLLSLAVPAAPERLRFVVLVLGLAGASLFFGDAMITPAISVLSAVTTVLLERPVRYRDLTMDTVDSEFLREGGTVLETVNKRNPFEYPMPDGSIKDRSAEAIEGFRALDLDALIGLGGDSSARILARLAEQGQIPFIGVPKTIDNRRGGDRLRHRLHERGGSLR